ncbi:hypothetical protein [Pararhizobium haloflavum]|uniref:hypothetical protein n=1 Tax=Pararhizobium haloflavum TaxID=2037914 RepID=UPI000C196E21|nr:hypothetical protein [Pararhizobium haloflavum]
MGFGLSIGGGGDFLPSIRINGKDGGVERSTWDGTERGLEVIDDFVALFDFATLKVGWIEFTDRGPDKRLVAIGDPLPDRPSEKHKQGIQLVVQLPGGLGCHELCSTAIGVVAALETVYDTAIATEEWKNGEVPVVRLTEFVREKTKHGNRAVPVFEIVAWKDRPAELEEHRASPRPRAAMPASGSSSRPAMTGSTQMTPPKPETSRTSVPDFG